MKFFHNLKFVERRLERKKPMFKRERFETEWAGRPLVIETGHFAAQANSACTVQYGETMVLATCVASKTARDGVDYLPLMVDYEERLYANGKIKGSRWVKREGKPTDEAVTTSRLIDRGIRPLLDERIRHDVQLTLTVLSYDRENTADMPALIAASAALAISDVPWMGPIAGVRVGRIDGEMVLNTPYSQREKSDFDIMLGGTTERISMLDARLEDISEADAFAAIEFGQAALAPVIDLIKKVQQAVGLEKRQDMVVEEKEEKLAVKNMAMEYINEQLPGMLFDSPKKTKQEKNAVSDKLEVMTNKYLEDKGIGKDKRSNVGEWVHGAIYTITSKMILDKDLRVDGRALDEVRPLTCEVDVLPHNHGSAVFQRGGTQVLSVVTLGSPSDEQYLDGMEESGTRGYFHHYNFRPFSVGEVGPARNPGRREIGHGMLAEKAILPMLPDKKIFPYTIRVVSEVLESNGSSSMASACASALSLMAAGVPLIKPVAGIAIGLASEKGADGHISKYKLFTDLQDVEDGDGGMDFKVTGTRDGVTAIQMDTKTTGLTSEITKTALEMARQARLKILDVMTAAIPAPRPQVSPLAPKIFIMTINPDKIRDVIGPGGKMINEIIAKTGANIDIEQDGTVFITCESQTGLDDARGWVYNLTREIAVGEIFEGTVVKLMDFGAFVELLPKQDGLVHISEFSDQRINRIEDVVKVGEKLTVKVIRVDDSGKISLSVKAAKAEKMSAPINQNPPAANPFIPQA